MWDGKKMLAGLVATALGGMGVANAATYRVGPDQEYKALQQVTGALKPGDLVEVAGDAVYPGGVVLTRSGTAEQPITVRGVRVHGRRPVISGSEIGVHFDRSNYCILEGFEIEKASARGIRHRAAYTTIRDCYVHDCPDQGILGSDTMSGSLTLEYVEVARCGGPPGGHSIYMSTDPVAFPGAVFRMEHCYVHDGTWGNAAKTRAERNEIYYNWLESNEFRALVLIGRDEEAGPRPMNSDVVGNVLIARGELHVVQCGYDGPPRSFGSRGRYRIVNNTLLSSPQGAAAIQPRGRLESLEMSNNIFFRLGGGVVRVLDEETALWTTGARICAGQNNWAPTGSACPPEWTGTLSGDDPGFVNLDQFDLHLRSGSPAVDAGVAVPQSPAGYPFPTPLFPPPFEPPLHAIGAIGSAHPRGVWGRVDLGAYEFVAVPSDDGRGR